MNALAIKCFKLYGAAATAKLTGKSVRTVRNIAERLCLPLPSADEIAENIAKMMVEQQNESL